MEAPTPDPRTALPLRGARLWTVIGLLLVALLQFGWNAAMQPAFWGYDEGAHAAVAFGISESGALPHPLSGWSSFHPPLAAVLGAWTLVAVETQSAGVALFGLRAWSILGVLCLAAVLFGLVFRRFGFGIAATTTALAVFLPVTQFAATMVGNEALAAGFGAAALPALLRLQRDPRDLRAALLFGLFAGLACATKYTGLWTLSLAALPFLRVGGSQAWRGLLLCFGVAVLVAGPFYLRNFALTGTPLPMTRELQPMKHFEERMEFRPRRIGDYLGIPWRCGQYPYTTVIAEGGAAILAVNPTLQSVPCMLHAGIWFDPFGIRSARNGPTSGVALGALLMFLGLIPTAFLAIGVVRGIRESFRTRGRAQETPLLVLLGLGLGSFAVFTWIAPSLAAAKASYLLPLVAPAGFFFAAGVAAAGLRIRRAAQIFAAVLAALLAVVFTTGVVFPPADAKASHQYWTRIGEVMPHAYIVEATRRLIDVGD